MSKSLIHRFPQLNTKSISIYGYVFLSKSDSKKYCKNEQFREYISAKIDIKRQLLLFHDILEDIEDLHILKTIYGIYYNTCLYSNIEELQFFDSNKSQKILDFNIHCCTNCIHCIHCINYIEVCNYLSYLHLPMYDIGSGAYTILTIGYENTII